MKSCMHLKQYHKLQPNCSKKSTIQDDTLCQLDTYIPQLVTVYCKSLEVENFCSFCGLIGNVKLFQRFNDNALVQYIRLPYNHKFFPVNFSSFLQPQNLSTSNNLQQETSSVCFNCIMKCQMLQCVLLGRIEIYWCLW